MKIYKLDVNTAKPIRQVVQMQQNSTGALSVNVSNNGKYIRNLSCALYEDGNEISAYATGGNSAGYKIDVGEAAKLVKFTAESVPTECSAQYILSVSSGTRVKNVWLDIVQLEAGTYNQDEFESLKRFAAAAGMAVWLSPDGSTSQNINIEKLCIASGRNSESRVVFFRDNIALPEDEQIVATGPVKIGKMQTYHGNSATLSTYMYPAVGYYTDYALDTVITPSENAHCYAEQDIADPIPDDDPLAETTEE